MGGVIDESCLRGHESRLGHRRCVGLIHITALPSFHDVGGAPARALRRLLGASLSSVGLVHFLVNLFLHIKGYLALQGVHGSHVALIDEPSSGCVCLVLRHRRHLRSKSRRCNLVGGTTCRVMMKGAELRIEHHGFFKLILLPL